jgi:hypothetical protein
VPSLQRSEVLYSCVWSLKSGSLTLQLEFAMSCLETRPEKTCATHGRLENVETQTVYVGILLAGEGNLSCPPGRSSARSNNAAAGEDMGPLSV